MPALPSMPPARRAAVAALAAGAALLATVVGTPVGAPVLEAAAAAPAATATVAAGSVAATARAEDDPLTVAIDKVNPGVIPERGSIRMAGTVTNDSDEQWRVIRIYPLTSATPFTTPEQLTEAAASDPAQPFGDRITTEGVYDTIDVLDPGETARFRVQVPRSELQISGEQGVYWIGIHALGETDAGREEVAVADGRDRVFIPLRDPPTGKKARARPQPTLDTAVVVPLRHQVRYAADGSLADPDGWTADLEASGALGRLLEIAREAGSRPLTWLVDPAVTDAVARLGEGNQPRSLADPPPAPTDETSDEPSEQPSPEPSGEASPASGATDASDTPSTGSGGTSARAATPPPAAWLRGMSAALVGDQILSLPYADTDVAGAAESDPGMYRLARQRAGRRVGALDLPSAPVVAPPGGFLDEIGFSVVGEEATVLASDLILDREARIAAPAVIETLGHRVYLTNSAVDQGSGPREDSVLDVRQRMLAESLVRLLDKRGPLVVTLPTDETSGWDPAAVGDLFTALDAADWVQLTTLGGLADRRARPIGPARLRYPERIDRQELSGATFGSARALIARGRLLDNVLPLNDGVAAQVEDEALTIVGYDDRSDEPGARAAAAAAYRWIDAELAKITVETPPSVTLSSESGRLSADVVNGTDQTVRVRIQAATDPGLEITATPVQELGPGERATVQMEATATTLAVHAVSLIVADENGQPVGTAATFPLRANQVSQVIWVVMALGVLLLFTTIGVRLTRRIRRGLADRRTRTHRSSGAAS